jgi:5-methylcytosine-specific restriction endonuclease McrA
MPAKRGHVYIGEVECKECSKCKTIKPITEYPKDNGKWDGLYPYCKQCKSERDKKVYQKNPKAKYEAVLKYQKRTGIFYQSHPYKQKYYNSPSSKTKKQARDMKRRVLKKNANAKCIISSAVIQEVIKKYNGKCAYCGVTCTSNYHIDHKLPLALGGGNEFENLALSCRHCNLSKGKKTVEQFMRNCAG